MSKIITIAEVKKHNRKNSLWMIIHNDVYNVTQFLDEHPGGEESLMDMAGREATQAFEDVGHSEDARELMKKYKIGTLPENEHSKEPVIAPCESNWKLYLALALLGVMAIGAIVKMKMAA